MGLSLSSCTSREWGCASATGAQWGIVPEVVKIIEKFHTTETVVALHSGWSRAMVMGNLGGCQVHGDRLCLGTPMCCFQGRKGLPKSQKDEVRWG